jgi:ABC-type uncharacterized transport system permease subunit
MILSPTSLAAPLLWPSAVAVLAYGLASVWPASPSQEGEADASRPLWAWLCLGWLAQTVAIGNDLIDWQGNTLQARFGFATALSTTTWLVLAVYAVEHRSLGWPSVRRALALAAALTCLLAWLFPGQPHPNSSSPWAPVHWMLGFASYGLFGVALLHAALLRRAERSLRAKPGVGAGRMPAGQVLGIPLLRLERLTLRFAAVGFVILSLTLLLGAWFAHPWRWDHKTVFSVLSWVVFAVLLVGRARFGWRGRQAIGWLTAGSTLLLLAYVGSRFVFEVLLHRPATTY